MTDMQGAVWCWGQHGCLGKIEATVQPTSAMFNVVEELLCCPLVHLYILFVYACHNFHSSLAVNDDFCAHHDVPGSFNLLKFVRCGC